MAVTRSRLPARAKDAILSRISASFVTFLDNGAGAVDLATALAELDELEGYATKVRTARLQAMHRSQELLRGCVASHMSRVRILNQRLDQVSAG